MTHKFS